MFECRICRAIPDTREDPLPREVEQLERFGGAAYRLRRCPLCGTYYDYFHDHDNGGGTSAGSTDESIRRLSPAETIEGICDALNELPFEPFPQLEADLERLLCEHPGPAESTDALIQRLDAAVLADDILGNEPANLASWWLGRRSAVRAIPTLVRALGVQYLRGHAARALASMGAVAAPALLRELAGDPVSRTAAACGLGQLARNDPVMAPAIQSALLARLAQLGESPDASEPVSRDTAAVVSAIGMTGYSEAAFAALVELFARTHGWAREAAIRAVGRMGAITVPALIRMLSHDDRHVVEAAILTLTELGPAARGASSELAAIPSTARLDHRIAAAQAAIRAPEPACRICRAIPDHADADAGLPAAYHELQHFPDPASDLCRCPLCATYYDYYYGHYPGDGVYCDPVTDEVITRLTPAQTLERILRALHELPFEPMPTLEADLERLLREHPGPVEPIDALIQRVAADTTGDPSAQLAAWSLGRRRVVEAIPTLSRALASGQLRGHAARALASMGPVAAPTLLARLEAGPVERTAAACGLGHLVRLAPDMAPAIQRALLTRLAALGEDPGTSEQASEQTAAVLWAIGMTGYSDEAFAALADRFSPDTEWRGRLAAIHAVSRMGAVTVPALVGMLGDEDPRMPAAIRALIQLGPAAHDALPVLAAHPLAARVDLQRARAAIAGSGPDRSRSS